MNIETSSWDFAEREIDRVNTPETRVALRRIDELTEALIAACNALSEAESRCDRHESECDEDVSTIAFDTAHNDADIVLLQIQKRLADRAVGDGNRFTETLRANHSILADIGI